MCVRRASQRKGALREDRTWDWAPVVRGTAKGRAGPRGPWWAHLRSQASARRALGPWKNGCVMHRARGQSGSCCGWHSRAWCMARWGQAGLGFTVGGPGPPSLPSPQTCLHSVQLQVEAVEGLEAFGRLDVLGLAQHADVHGHLEVVLLLTHEGVITHRKVETLVGVHTVGEHGPGDREGTPQSQARNVCPPPQPHVSVRPFPTLNAPHHRAAPTSQNSKLRPPSQPLFSLLCAWDHPALGTGEAQREI